MISKFGETPNLHTSHETECNTEVHCGGVAVVETEYYKGDIPQASSCGLFRISEAGKKVAVATSSVPLAYVYCLVIPLTLSYMTLEGKKNAHL